LYRDLQGCKGFTGLYRGVQGCIRVYRVVEGLTGLYRGLQGCIGVYRVVSLGVYRVV